MILYIVRHAWAADRGDSSYPDDSLRPVTEEGAERFGHMVKQLSGRGFLPARVATSPFVRCRQTADVIAQRVAAKPVVTALDELASEAQLEPLLAWTRRYGDADVAWVGHAPDVGHLAAALMGDAAAAIHFSKGAIAAIAFNDRIGPGLGQLLWLVTAKVLGC
jgi:phosphohistidine phosphatase